MTIVLNEVIGGDRESTSHFVATNGNQILNHFDGSAHRWTEISSPNEDVGIMVYQMAEREGHRFAG